MGNLAKLILGRFLCYLDRRDIICGSLLVFSMIPPHIVLFLLELLIFSSSVTSTSVSFP